MIKCKVTNYIFQPVKEWCNNHNVGFIVGIGRNSRLTDKSCRIIAEGEKIRLKLLKIGAEVTRNTRTVRVMLSSSFPFQYLFRLVSHRLASG